MGALLDLLVLINSQSLSVPKGDTEKREKKGKKKKKGNKWDSRTNQCVWLAPERGLEHGKMKVTSDMNSYRR